MRKLRKILIAFLIFLLIMLAGLLYVNNWVNKSLGTSGKEGTFEVVEGSTGRAVFNKLEDEGYINNSIVAYYYSRFSCPSNFKSGNYELTSDMDLEDMINYMSDGSNAISKTVNITFIEGDWLIDFASKIGEATSVSEEEILAYWSDETVLRSLIDQYEFLTEDIFNEDIRHPLEGYLFPETYTFYRETTAEEITAKILNQTLTLYEEYKDDFNNSQYSIHQLFTLASIVQYEAANYDDMKLVASVFYNRLNIDMPLQSSVTVCYALGSESREDWRACEYNPDYDSPYNTYMYYGLPPGPILSAGRDAFEAVLQPEESNYYFFIADVCGDGQVYFAETYEQHLQYMEEYLTCY